MATRKSNKTAHVLNLISKAKEEHQAAEDDFEINSIDNVQASDLSFINTEISNDNELSDEIRENLSKTFESDDSSNLDSNNIVVTEKEEVSVMNIDEALKNDLSDNTQVNADESSEIINQDSPATREPSAQNSLGYSYVNVVEEVVKLRVDEFVEMFDVCKCPRCRADIIALAMNDLTPKYIVVDSSHVSPLLNFFSNNYSGAVTAQLSRACTIVKENPHH